MQLFCRDVFFGKSRWLALGLSLLPLCACNSSSDDDTADASDVNPADREECAGQCRDKCKDDMGCYANCFDECMRS